MGKKSNLKKLQDKAESLWKELIRKRDKVCQLHKHFPKIAIPCSEVLQADHCISRRNKHFFLDPRNGTLICRNGNMAKSLDNKSISRAIDEIVKLREGSEFFNMAVSVDQTHRPNLNWKDPLWLEFQISRLEKEIERYSEER